MMAEDKVRVVQIARGCQIGGRLSISECGNKASGGVEGG